MTSGELQKAQLQFQNVFARVSSTRPFHERMSGRLLLYPIDYVFLDRAQFAALSAVSIHAGVHTAYFAGFGGEGTGWAGTSGHRLVRLGDYEDYSSTAGDTDVEHFLFAAGGEWGVVTSDGEYAVVGGSEQMVSHLREALRYDQESVLQSFIRNSREMAAAGGATAWVPLLLQHVMGAEEAGRITSNW